MNIEETMKKLTLEEKAKLVAGRDMWNTEKIERLGIPSIMVSDGPHGLRKQNPAEGSDMNYGEGGTIDAVCFPAACATSASFDRAMMEEMGKTIGEECLAEDVQVILGPAVNIKRSPLCGRNFEYVSEDPYVAGELAASFINGVQSKGVGTSIKHFAANNQEFERMYGSSEVDERTLREIYFPAFETAVKKADPWTFMCSYNKINGEYSSESKWLLTDLLRKDWGYKGLVMSDWAAVSDRVKGIAAGLDLEMPGCHGVNEELIIKAVKEGKLKESALDKAVKNVLKLVKKALAGRIEPGSKKFDRESDHRKAVEFARNCIVMLKNEGEALPLRRNIGKSERVTFIGEFAEKPRYQGGGSSHISTSRIDSALVVAERYAERYGNVEYAKGFPADKDVTKEEEIEKYIDEAIRASQSADKIVVFAGLPDSFESEGYDRNHMKLPEIQNKVIETLLTLDKQVIVVLHNGSPVEMPWADEVSAIVEAYLGGEGIGEAVVDVLYGAVNPSGRLAESIPYRYEDNPSYLNFPGHSHKVNYAEGLFVGYRYYDSKDMDVRYPFGHGISYTTFEYSDLKVMSDAKNNTAVVTVNVKNTGSMEGKDVVQLYVADKTGFVTRPSHELKGFEKVDLKAGEQRMISFTLDSRAFSYYDVDRHSWEVPEGKFVIEIGHSSKDIVLTEEISLDGTIKNIPFISNDVQLGELLECDLTKDYIVKAIEKYITAFGIEQGESNSSEMMAAVLKFMPLRGLRNFGGITNKEIDKIVEKLKKLVGQN
ncbi:beta-glucosidase [Eubacterium ruminantium]|uniref:Beta-glucosidase n=1 Tax=Eubacterium ruminantium TaxID=42322 RepID=A0A1T4KKV5_9FIRM|nr:glycoside hydrolase family 3 C-terminal domain-containing protein [Eubacterium ruminantium]SCW32966.1 beta-glucosidase [Eubacterium ruminantium]SDM29468.1 beta-glucosidase [Eubacterium ruminantium]SJZ43062.1 beta-glucosidase [Eubacterium ruminantium]